MYHTIAGECQTQFVREKARNKGVFALRRPKLRRVRAPIRPPPAAAAPPRPETSAALVFSSPATAWPALRASARRSTTRCGEQRLDPRREVGRHPQLAASPRGRSSPLPAAWPQRRRVGADPDAAAGQPAGEIGHHLAVRPGDEADQPRLRPALAGDDAAPLRLVPLPSPAPRASPPQARLSAAASALLAAAASASAGTRSAGSTQPSWTRAFITSVCASSRLMSNFSSRPVSFTRLPSTVV